MPFLENVTRGRNVPRERLMEVAEHYEQFGGVSPINAQNRALIAALEHELDAARRSSCRSTSATATGTRCWPTRCARCATTASSGRCVLHLGVSARIPAAASTARTSSPRSRRSATDAPEVLRSCASSTTTRGSSRRTSTACGRRLPSSPSRRAGAPGVHGAQHPGGDGPRTAHYEEQLRETCRLVAEAVGWPTGRSSTRAAAGRRTCRGSSPTSSTICARSVRAASPSVVHRAGRLRLRPSGGAVRPRQRGARHGGGARPVVARAGTPSTHPAFVSMIRELVQERLNRSSGRRAVGRFAAGPGRLPVDCCLPGTGRPSPWAAAAVAADA